jgi:hypothetical protein
MKSSKTSTTLGFAALAIFTAPLTVAADPGWYFGASGGPSQTDVDEDRIAADLLARASHHLHGRQRTRHRLQGVRWLSIQQVLLAGEWLLRLGDFGYTSFSAAGTLHGVLGARGLNLDAVLSMPFTRSSPPSSVRARRTR